MTKVTNIYKLVSSDTTEYYTTLEAANIAKENLKAQGGKYSDCKIESVELIDSIPKYTGAIYKAHICEMWIPHHRFDTDKISVELCPYSEFAKLLGLSCNSNDPSKLKKYLLPYCHSLNNFTTVLYFWSDKSILSLSDQELSTIVTDEYNQCMFNRNSTCASMNQLPDPTSEEGRLLYYKEIYPAIILTQFKYLDYLRPGWSLSHSLQLRQLLERICCNSECYHDNRVIYYHDKLGCSYTIHSLDIELPDSCTMNIKMESLFNSNALPMVILAEDFVYVLTRLDSYAILLGQHERLAIVKDILYSSLTANSLHVIHQFKLQNID